jgi:hypothetical protein
MFCEVANLHSYNCLCHKLLTNFYFCYYALTGGEAHHHHIGEASRIHNRRVRTITRTQAPTFITGG